MDISSLPIPKINSVRLIAIDFDGTLYNRMTNEPYAAAARALKQFRNWGYELYIYSARASSRKNIEWMKEWLKENKLSYDTISNIKPDRLTWIIDDRAIYFQNNWPELIESVKSETFPWKQ